MQTETEIAAWAAKLENLESRMLEELQEQFEKEDNTVWEVFPESSQEVVEVKVVEEDGQGYQRGELKFLGGEVFQGRFSVDLKHRAGKLYKDARFTKLRITACNWKFVKDSHKVILFSSSFKFE